MEKATSIGWPFKLDFFALEGSGGEGARGNAVQDRHHVLDRWEPLDVRGEEAGALPGSGQNFHLKQFGGQIQARFFSSRTQHVFPHILHEVGRSFRRFPTFCRFTLTQGCLTGREPRVYLRFTLSPQLAVGLRLERLSGMAPSGQGAALDLRILDNACQTAGVMVSVKGIAKGTALLPVAPSIQRPASHGKDR